MATDSRNDPRRGRGYNTDYDYNADFGSSSPKKWHVIGSGSLYPESRYDVISRLPVNGVNALKQISATDKAKAVPYAKIYNVDRNTNVTGSEISTQFWEVPDFGKSLKKRFGERPNVSLESITVKNVNPKGFILYREVDISIKVHRPEVVFNNLDDQSSAVSSLMT